MTATALVYYGLLLLLVCGLAALSEKYLLRGDDDQNDVEEVVQATDENDVKRQLTRAQKRKILRCKHVFDPALDPPARLKSRR